MGKKVEAHDEAIRVLLEQYKENLRQLFREGKLSHQQLENQLSHVVDSVNEEIRKITAEVITEEGGVKKTADAPCANEKQKSTKKRRH